MSNKGIGAIIAVALAVFIAANTVYVVSEYERGVVLRFGRMVQADLQPGLHVKIPFADRAQLFDGRVITVDAPPESYFTVESKRLIVDSYAKWRIVDVATYYRATGGLEATADSRLSERIQDGLRNQVGLRTLHEVVSGQRDELMEQLTESLNVVALDQLGVEILDVRVRRIDLPVDVSQSVFDRMSADRNKEAQEYRATGREQGEVIRADADRQRAVLLANAYRDAELLRGDGDARAAAIFADAFGQDPEFYAFTRSLNAYRSAFSTKEDLMVVDPSSEFFRFLNNSQGRGNN
ncbi:protease modulator HflC [Marinimicrobium sp. ABcell2]|uniref:protease modulator HflC n=1 Tax=Marinimicrobium sp. ABcell2 TaxID=3069751 RepID=UPI0027B04B53|nr:protease modulator HflC [Marinimicrobium sp. ABcell2]MDQ2076365.1 protease modulator HflC [Marinimicrobium sp. ABcell2]